MSSLIFLLCLYAGPLTHSFVRNDWHSRVPTILLSGERKAAGFAGTKAGKSAVLERTKILVENADLILAIDGKGITKEQVDALRKAIPETSKATVIKNTLLGMNIRNSSKFSALADILHEQNLFLFFPEDDTGVTLNAVQNWRRDTQLNPVDRKLKVGIIGNELFLGDRLENVFFQLRSRVELMSRLVQALRQVPLGLVSTLKALGEKLSAASNAPAAEENNNTKEGTNITPPPLV